MNVAMRESSNQSEGGNCAVGALARVKGLCQPVIELIFECPVVPVVVCLSS